MDYDPQELEARWRERWAEEGRYEADPADAEAAVAVADDTDASDDDATGDADADSDDPTFITVPYPYPSGGMHIGHARTYTVPDVYARYRRQQGDNVLFPIAWHVTGTPIIGAVERLKKGEEDQLSVLRDTYNVAEDTLEDLETPMGYARHFIEEHYKRGMKDLGLSIDWRREFTTNDDRYSKFITWQYETLRDRGLLEKGLHPVKYCTNEEQPVTTHDLLEGEEAEFQEYTLIRFGHGDTVVPMATLRPETVRGVTNAYIDPDADYVVADVDGEEWFVSAAAVEKLQLQGHEVVPKRTVSGEHLVGERVTNPITGDEVLVLPADFVDADNATGVVMSVPAHSPDDYVALEEAKADDERMAEYGIDPAEVEEIEPIPILSIEGYGEVPAKTAVEEAGIESSTDPALEEATKELYNSEFHRGRLNDEYGEFAGEVVEDVRGRFRDAYREEGAFGTMREFSEEVVCRCGGDVVVAEQDTWFLRYNDEAWKQKAHDVVSRMEAVPENTRGEYDHTIDWLNEWPCIRNYGLGTRLPWDDEFVIEPLSDSTIYMAYYTIAHRLEEIPPEDLDREFFDALFYGADAVEDPDERALELRSEWLYWYPVTYRFSANDLISNHLTFYLFHHAELFDQPQWPEGIVIMGMGLLEGEKMSSSKGHVVLPGKAIEEYGADTVRFFLLNSAEPWQDYDWRAEQVASVRNQLERFWNRAQDVIENPGPEERPELATADRWLLSRLQRTVETVTEAMEGSETRTASQAAFYDFEEDLRWYRRRTDRSRPAARWTLREVLETRLRLLAPFVPFLTNELHERLTGTPAEDAPWPEVDEDLLDRGIEAAETQVERLVDDIQGIRQSLQNAEEDVPEADPDRIRITVAADWKRDVFATVAELGADQGAVMSEVMQDPDLRERGNAVNDLVGELVEFARGRDDGELSALAEVDEGDAYERAADFLATEFDAEIVVQREGDDAEAHKQAVPFRPAIELEAE
ncbi:leucine--tRNA ligase [Halobellus limi]|uniref:Leucine--tRNA ligase n=1 Tax=Halobellus limi TaxID=699433 RepID=A0A1H6C5U0_9EURY|nr:leucine--tRNA ligase [Halobellus limi]QCC48653.1 leucine--tRNA ligase [Halobellus limi]SEG68339.1 leucyl-tRNA synthetase [Halobellus limi]